MDSWSYGRSVFLPNETLLPSDSIPQNRKSITGFDHRLSDDDVLMSDFADRSFADLAGKSDNGFKVASSSSCVVPLNLLHEEVEENQSSSSKLSRIDFKLRSFLDYGNSVNNDDDTSSSRAFAIPAKKPRASSLCSQTPPLCQVYGCNMDLTSSKDYHKRHRVCETHSKTSVVIVSGIEQRFCQQCSRFHFLSEFDDGKRSCRRRLAGHNERRRKPSFYFLPGKQHKLLRTSQGVLRNKFLESSSVDDFSLVLPEAYPGSRLYRASSRLMSFNEEPTCSTTFPASYSPEASGALSLLSAQSQQQQQHFSETPNTVFSITQPNQNLNHQMEASWIINHGKTKSVSSTVDLLQLSSHLQRIEQQRNFDDEVKQEYNELYFPGS